MVLRGFRMKNGDDETNGDDFWSGFYCYPLSRQSLVH